MTSENVEPARRRTCFVTIGATATFNALIAEVLSPAFLDILRQSGYTNLLLQYGKGASIYETFTERNPPGSNARHGITIEGFGFNPQGLGQEMRLAKGASHKKTQTEWEEGVVVSHAGSGSILDALRLNAPLIVVPNPDLLDNHQVELAEELAAQGYVVHGRLGKLAEALHESDELRKQQKAWPPVNSGADPSGRGLAGVMDDEMGFLD